MSAPSNRRSRHDPDDVVDRIGLATETLGGLINTLISQEVGSSGAANPILLAAQRYIEDIEAYVGELEQEGATS